MVVIDEKTIEKTDWEPKIVGFLCKWCSYAGADLAGISRIDYPPNSIFIKVPCTGRVDPTFVLKAFADGADAVFISGCHPGDCHYIEGNYKTMRRYELLKETLKQFGIDERRFQLTWISASEAQKLKEFLINITSSIKELGPIQLPTLAPLQMEDESNE
ncbi:MAG: hydrogenase iron-sulfur subunit [Candidatus Heimdallarchaeota archaeon]|nr:hydrogenase iron-sulfur subunit [Candidatus Heimdallarchaeota archaeon]MCK4878658.1 hydrogenase iron-sulfur subunit [Candidatus Heimdallarchaeota archaeon]